MEEDSIELRKKAWRASKEIGLVLAPKIVDLVKLRNEAARHLGYENYFDMMLDLNDINKEKLFKTFADLKKQTDETFNKLLIEIDEKLSRKFGISTEELGPWAWKDPFCQIDPLSASLLNETFSDKDILAISKTFYEKMGFYIDNLIENSDLYEREGKSQHAFCISIDRKKDVRTLQNIKLNVQWMETLLHEFGHGIYDLNIDENLPWLLREHPHVLVSEAIAFLMERQIYTKKFLEEFCDISDEELLNEIEKGYLRDQLLRSRSVFLITDFENEMYKNPTQDLNKLWWDLYKRYYNMSMFENRENKADWAAKNHIGLAPVYYYSYLLGDVFSSSLQKKLLKVVEDDYIWKKQTAKFLKEKVFRDGSKYRWDILIKHVLNKPFSSDEWIEECNKLYLES
jgi:peptidyl-dipeptidase A